MNENEAQEQTQDEEVATPLDNMSDEEILAMDEAFSAASKQEENPVDEEQETIKEETVDDSSEKQDDVKPEEDEESDGEAGDSDVNDTVDTSSSNDDSSSNGPDEDDDGDLLLKVNINGTEVPIKDVEEARILIEKGIQAQQKYEKSQDKLSLAHTLEEQGIKDQAQVNLLIEAAKGKPEAIVELLKQNELSIEDIEELTEKDTEYKPDDYSVDKKQLAVGEVLNELAADNEFNKTADVLRGLDQADKALLEENPEDIRVLHDHIKSGVYNQIQGLVLKEKMQGNLQGMTQLQAYQAMVQKVMESVPDISTSNTATNKKEKVDKTVSTNDKSKAASEAADASSSVTSGKGRKDDANEGSVDLDSLSDEDILAIDFYI